MAESIETRVAKLEEKVASLEAQIVQIMDSLPSGYYTLQFSGEEIETRLNGT